MAADDLLAFLELFTQHDARRVVEIVNSLPGREKTRVEAYVEVFRLLGLLQPDPESELVHTTTASEHSRLFFAALAEIQRSAGFALGDFTSSGASQPWVRTLSAIEEWRTADNQAKPVRGQLAAQIVIVGEMDGIHYVLLDYDPENWGSYRLVGGKAKRNIALSGFSRMETAATTIDREMREEVFLGIKETLSVDPVWRRVEARSISRRLGAYTDYVFIVFRVERYTGRPFQYTGDRATHLRWVRVEDVLWALENAPALIAADVLSNEWVVRELSRPAVLYQLRESDRARVAVRASRSYAVIE